MSDDTTTTVVVKKRRRSRCVFRDEWLLEDDMKEWIVKVSDVVAKCKVCVKTINLSNMGIGALRSHVSKSTTHAANIQLWREQRTDLQVF